MAQQRQRIDLERIRDEFRPWMLGLAPIIPIAAAAAWWTEDPGLREVAIGIGVGATAILAALVTLKGFFWLLAKASQENRDGR